MHTGLKPHRLYDVKALAEVYRGLAAEAGVDTLPVFDRNFQSSRGEKRLVAERIANDPSFFHVSRTRSGDGFFVILDFIGRQPLPSPKADPWDTGLSKEWRSLPGAFKGAIFVAHPLSEEQAVDAAFLERPAVREALLASLKSPLPVCSYIDAAIVLHEAVRGGQIERVLALREDPANYVPEVQDCPVGVPENALGPLAADLARVSPKGLEEVGALVHASTAEDRSPRPQQTAGADAPTALMIGRIAEVLRAAGRPVSVQDLSLVHGLDHIAVAGAVTVMTHRGWGRLFDDDRLVLTPTMPDVDSLDLDLPPAPAARPALPPSPETALPETGQASLARDSAAAASLARYLGARAIGHSQASLSLH